MLILLAVAASLAVDSTTYVVSNHGRPAGEMIVRTSGDSTTVRFWYVDRNRGPRSETVYRIDKQGRVWVSLASGHMGVFDRRLCKGPLNGPNATGNHCPEGWAFHKYPGPGFKGIGENSAESSYYTWVDQHNTFGLGEDVPMSTGNLNDGLIALKDGKMIVLRVPYPLGFYAKGFDGRIDDPNAGWKGRGLWSTSGDRTPWLMEGGKGSKPRAVHVQLRPDPLAR